MALALRSKGMLVILGSCVDGFGGGRSGLGWLSGDGDGSVVSSTVGDGFEGAAGMSSPLQWVVGDALAFVEGGVGAVRPMVRVKARCLWRDLSAMAVVVVEPPAAVVARPRPARWSLPQGFMARACRAGYGQGEVGVDAPSGREVGLGRW